ncbi:MAG TPA: MerR family DNA-binding transcriptional regulator, partial [bacterium]|nr:MerR family DNA-binding transcriptional regulator [bacterium]
MSLPAQDIKNKNKEKTDSKYVFHRDNFLRVSNASKIVGVSPSTMRRLESEGLISSHRDPKSNYRLYRLDELKELKNNLEQKKLQKYEDKINKDNKKSISFPNSNLLGVVKPAKIKLNENKLSRESSGKKFSEKRTYKRDIDSEKWKIPVDKEKKSMDPLWKKTRMGISFAVILSCIIFSLYYVSKNGGINDKGNLSSVPKILGFLQKNENSGQELSKKTDNVLAARTKVSDFVQNFNLETFFKKKATFEAGLEVTDINFVDTGTVNNLLRIDDVTKRTLEESLGIDGEIIGTNMLSTVIAEGVVDGKKLAPEIEYNGSFDFAEGSLLIDGTEVEASAGEINVLSGIKSTTEELNYLSDLVLDNGGILFGNDNSITQDKSYLFWNSEDKSLEIGNGTNYTGFKASDYMSQDLIYTLPENAGLSDYVLSIQNGNVLEWREVTSIPGSGDITSVGSMTEGDVFNSSSVNGQWIGFGESLGRLQFQRSDSNIDSINILDARLGIGITNPYFDLDVAGSVNTEELYISGTQVQSSAVELNLLHNLPGVLLDSSIISLYATTGINAGQGLIGGGTTGVLTLDVGVGDGIVVNSDNISLDVITSGSTANTSSNSGLELTSEGLRIIGGCSDDQVLSWNETTLTWECNYISSLIGVISGSGEPGQVAFFVDPYEQSGSNNLFWDISNSRLGIGTTSPSRKLEV